MESKAGFFSWLKCLWSRAVSDLECSRFHGLVSVLEGSTEVHEKRAQTVVWDIFCPHQDPTDSNFLGTPGEDYFKGNPKSLNFYFLVIWWGKYRG